jgi:alpha-L-fucosidase
MTGRNDTREQTRVSAPSPALSRRGFIAATGGAALAALAPAVAIATPGPMASAMSPASRPRPSSAQLAWQREELAMFVHFGVNTFTGREWGEGDEDPRIFDPARLDARQWARTAKQAGFASMILTAKHHDGFCLWPTATTRHSVASSQWRGGKGDLVREFVDACREEGLGVGLYLSPWDRNATRYGQGDAYNDFYIAQLTELLTGYGDLVELWFDGANGEGPNGRRQAYDWPRIHRTVRELQPGAVIFSDAGPDVRWIGNERGAAGVTCWSSVDPARVPQAGADDPWTTDALQQGDPDGSVWRPGETDVSIRPGWFWHAEENEKVRPPDDLLGLYFSSVGRNSKLLLNVPPSRDGLFQDADVRALHGFGMQRRALLDRELLRGARVQASASDAMAAASHVLDDDRSRHWMPGHDARAGWLEFELPQDIEFDVVRLHEAIEHGQHVAAYRFQAWQDSGWHTLAWGTTIGCCRLARVAPTRARRLRLSIDFAYDTPRLQRVALHRMPRG